MIGKGWLKHLRNKRLKEIKELKHILNLECPCMSTFTERSVIIKMLENNGVYSNEVESDPQVWGIYQYTNSLSKEVCWKVIYKSHVREQLDEFLTSPYMWGASIIKLWQFEQGLTLLGKKFLEGKEINLTINL